MSLVGKENKLTEDFGKVSQQLDNCRKAEIYFLNNQHRDRSSPSLHSRRYSRARENGKLEIPPAQKLHILSSLAAECRSILIGQNVDLNF